jgi:hypothetical protein
MSQYKFGYVGSVKYVRRVDDKTTPVWVVTKFWSGGKCERVGAYFGENVARARAGEIAGADGATVGIERIEVFDLAPREATES